METEAILRLKKSKLYLSLLKKEEEDHQLSSKLLKIVEEVAPLLQRIPENMKEYTLHDSSHSAKIVEIMGKILPDEVLNNLNTIEITLLILSAYLHDIGMTCEKEEKEKIISSDEEYNILFKSNLDKFQKYEQYLAENNHRNATFIQDQIFTEYLRRKHVERSSDYISDKLAQGELCLNYNSIPFYKTLGKICDAHGEPVKSLYDIKKWPKQTLVGEKIVNVQFISLILRLGDILDLDSERTPKVIYEFVNPEDPISIIEWQKHRSVLGSSIGSNQILFESECSSPEVERALRQFMDWIEIERKETMELLKTYSPEEKAKYFLSLNDPVSKDRIHSDGTYIYGDLAFNLDFHRIMSLLMGQKLYRDSTTAVRELIQNSLDAIKVRMVIYEKKKEKFDPLVKITLTDSALVIEDNGIGMDESIFKDFFLQIGKSYYSSPRFYSKHSGIDVTSEFGIGILSVFMLASSINIESRKEPDDPINPFLPICYDIPTAHSFIIQREGQRKEIGTQITLKLLGQNPFKNKSLINILEEIIPNPPFPIATNENGVEVIYNGKNNVSISFLDYKKENTSEILRKIKYYDTQWNSLFTHGLFSVNFNESPNAIEGISGNLLIVNSNPVNYYGTLSGCVCQRNFSVGFPGTNDEKFSIKLTDSILGLFPKWISGFSVLNFTSKSCLSLSPERSEFIIDEKYKIIKSKIEEKIIVSYKSHFDEFIKNNGEGEFVIYLDFLYSAGFFGIDLEDRSHPSEKAKAFLKEYVSFPVLQDDGSLKRIKAKDLFLKNNIGVIYDRYNKNDIKKLIDFKRSNDLEIVFINEVNFRNGRNDTLLESLMGSREHFLKPLKLLLKPLPDSPINLIKFNNKDCQNVLNREYDIFDAISNSDSIVTDLPVVFALRGTYIYPQFNSTHPLISFLFDKNKKDVEYEDVKNALVHSIVKTINESVSKFKESDDKELMKVAYGNDTIEITKGILGKDKELLDRLKVVFKELHSIAKQKGMIEKSAQMPLLTIEDLPWYWI